jgi:hypothetical protein
MAAEAAPHPPTLVASLMAADSGTLEVLGVDVAVAPHSSLVATMRQALLASFLVLIPSIGSFVFRWRSG